MGQLGVRARHSLDFMEAASVLRMPQFMNDIIDEYQVGTNAEK